MKTTQNKTRYFLVLALLAGLFSNAKNYGQGTWLTKANYSSLRTGAAGFSIGSKGYVGTGSDNTGAVYNDFWEYDPSGNTWTQKASFAGQPRINAVGFSIGLIGYIGTGMNGLGAFNDFWAYDPVINMWTQRANISGTGRHSAVGFSISNTGYIGTGQSAGNGSKDFWAYTPATNIWTRKADFGGFGRWSAVGLVIGNNGYIGTGWNGNKYNDFWKYDPLVNTWTQKANFGGSQRWRAAGFSIGMKGYIGNGWDGALNMSDFWEYDTTSNSWAVIAGPPLGRMRSVSFVIGNKGYLGTGETLYNNSWSSPGTNNLFEFTPLSPLPVELVSFHAVSSNGIVNTRWLTASEVNNDYFEIERSSDGKTFESIGKINGAGNSTTNLSYSFNDKQPLNGVSYYRLKQTDFNGSFIYSKLERVTFEKKDTPTTTVSLFPNPVTEKVFVKVSPINDDLNQIHFMIFDLNGKDIVSQTLASMDHSLNGTFTFERGNLKSGTYFYQVVASENQIGSGKLIIQ